MYKEQFAPWVPGVKVINLEKWDVAIIHTMSNGQPHFGKSEIDFLVKLYQATRTADNAIVKTLGA